MTSFRTGSLRIDFFSKWSIFDVIDFEVGHFAKWLILRSDLFQKWTIFEAIELEVIQLRSDPFFEVTFFDEIDSEVTDSAKWPIYLMIHFVKWPFFRFDRYLQLSKIINQSDFFVFIIQN